ncbi:aminotransferase class IV [Hoylesella marshii]|uniref:aminotransferase class IV n=1 Tax=Hoylesella marshii TaxID=189722 RepID=UPI000A9FFAD2|nr:aminotransferase class IV [Hoylesella marshii]
MKGVCDDVLIVRNGLLTDTSYTNIALYDGYQWFTPATPLLEGTMRASLLDSGMLIEKDILLSDLPHYQYIALFNAMIDMGELVLPISCVHTKKQSLSV